ncbi:MAG: histidine phosphatase family protein, partial [Albidovulum sp.]|uniref:histidine phosphatase family protein n=1 Tax=Albidovulum sp. TaxID=1872424 RepID=UPI003CB56FEC
MRSFPELYILRHGQTEWNAVHRMQGALDSPLTALGREQAGRQAGILARTGVGAENHSFHVSPQGRARQTAEIVLGPLGIVPEVDARLREISLGTWDGLTQAGIEARNPGIFDGDHPFLWQDRAPEGTGFAAFDARLRDYLADLTGPTVIIAHGMVSLFLRGAVLGLDLDGIAGLPGGQGVVYHLKDGIQTRLE